MIENRITPNINIFSDLSSRMPIDEFSQKGFGVSNLERAEGASFKNVLSGMISNINNEVQKPDQLLNQQMTGNTDVDIHDVMTAMAKAELSVNIATTVTGKVLQAYDRIMQIQI